MPRINLTPRQKELWRYFFVDRYPPQLIPLPLLFLKIKHKGRLFPTDVDFFKVKTMEAHDCMLGQPEPIRQIIAEYFTKEIIKGFKEGDLGPGFYFFSIASDETDEKFWDLV